MTTKTGLSRVAVSATILAAIVLIALAAPILPLADPVRQDIGSRLAGPSAMHWLGQDEYGRDVFSRIVWGGRISLAVAFMAAAAAAVLGTLLGLVGAYFRGLTELFTVRTSEIVLCFPPLLLALLVVTLLGPGATTLILVLSLLFTPGFVRVAYGETLSVRALDYVTAQVALGAGTTRILSRVILPNIAPPLLVQFSLTVAAAMVLESGLSFLGLGVVPPAPSWGLMIRGARSAMDHAPLLLFWPCLALTGTVLTLNALCDGLRDLLDPRAHSARLAPAFLQRTRPSGSCTPHAAGPAHGDALISVRGLTLAVDNCGEAVLPVRDVSFDLSAGETLAIVGESGSGKTLTVLALMGLLPGTIRPVQGEALFAGRDGTTVDLLALGQDEMRRLRGDQIAMVFQDPSVSLNPLLRVGDQVMEPIHAHGVMPAAKARERAAQLLRDVGLPDPDERIRAYPHELSGGQRQRVMIAAAIVNGPRLLLADEPTTALDVTVQAQILELLARAKTQLGGMGLVFVTHNLAVVSEIAQRVLIMYAGEVMESGPAESVLARPRHPYTAALIASVPEGEAERLAAIPGAVPPPAAKPEGCRFAPRCGYADGACATLAPVPALVADSHVTYCRRWNELA